MSIIRANCFNSTPLHNLLHQSDNASTILTLCKFGKLKEAVDTLFTNPGPHLPSSTYSSLLQLCIDLKAEKEGKYLHKHLSAIGFAPDVILSTKFVIFYSKIGDGSSARRVFDEMPERTIVTWTAMISCYSQNGYPEEALEIFRLMRNSGCRPNQYTFGGVLSACGSVGCLRSGEQIHGCVVKSRFCGNLFVQSALMDMYLRCRSVKNALLLFNGMTIKDVVSWNSIIRGVSDHGLYDKTFRLFGLMIRDGMKPDHITLASILKICASIKVPANVDIIHSLVIKLGFLFDHVARGSLIDSYAKCGRMTEAKAVYHTTDKHDLILCTALITGYSNKNEREGCKEALETFSEINRLDLKLDGIILCSMLSVCANLANLGLGKQIHARLTKCNLHSDVALCNALIDMYAKSGDLNDARHVFYEMPTRNVVSWTSLMSSYGKFGCNEDALALFSDMEKDGVKPNDVTFLAIMTSCAYAGQSKEGMELFNSMVRRYKIKPRAEHYCSAVNLLARGGNLDEAFEFVQKMNFKPNTSIWGALVGACGAHINLALGKVAADNIFTLDPVKFVNYVALANIYAAQGLWKDVYKIRRLMWQKSIKKDLGFSLLPE
ncbi:Pentatricopeptide repeat-containing protein [Rhynchospora pubera]|uniref:Pentatricopeptide repeat-containing protein n=1 Tax=Rhynchospora pubera TaxID=906938 RepID=A0AAV8HZE5_9POAL|nr:Pentatricopeptide repeat-containing protein [Rhynchospora pubera]